MLQIRMTYTLPDQLQKVDLGDGRVAMERIPSHPTRPARESDWAYWFEDVTGDVPEGAITRLV